MKPLQHGDFVDALTPAPARNNAGAPLSSLERHAVDVALCDTLASLGEDGRVARAARLLFGGRRSAKLADPGLEALRRFAVLVRHAPSALDRGEIECMHVAGFSNRQMDQVFAIVERAPPRPPVRFAGALLSVAIPTGAGFAAFAWLRMLLDDRLAAMAVLATILLHVLATFWSSTRR
jgi:hypothetical protein